MTARCIVPHSVVVHYVNEGTSCIVSDSRARVTANSRRSVIAAPNHRLRCSRAATRSSAFTVAGK